MHKLYKLMIQGWRVLPCLLLAMPVHAEKIIQFKENKNVEVTISRDNLNRLLVANDKIINLRFPQSYLNIENDKDGSVYIDARDDRPFTLFVTTRSGRHFSATVKLSNDYGQTIKFVPERVVRRFAAKAKPKKKVSYQSQLVKLMKAAEQEKGLVGFKATQPHSKAVKLLPTLKSALKYSLTNNKQIVEKFTLNNTGWKPIPFDSTWFKNKDTKALLVKSQVIYPRQSLTVLRVQGVQHG